jgi:hypothetical protein
MIIDPGYVARDRVQRLAHNAGFALSDQFGSRLAFTLNFRRSE